MAEMKRILHIIGGLDRGGAESFLMNAWRNIDKSKYQFDILTFLPPRNGKKFAYEEELIAGGAKIYRIKDNRVRHPWKFEKDIAKIVRDNHYNTVHSHIDFMSAISLAGAKKGGAKGLISHSHNTYNKNLDSFIKRVASYFLRKRLNAIANTKLACGEKAGEFLYGRESKFIIIPNGIDLTNFAFSISAREELRLDFNLNHKTKVILNVGRLEKVKNQAFLIRAFEEYVSKEPESALFIIGDGTLKDSLEEQIGRSSAKKKIFLLPSRADINRFYSMADIFALPSTFEGVPTVGIEAQSCGLKCLFSTFVPKETKAISSSRFLTIDNTQTWARAFQISKINTAKRSDALNSERLRLFDIRKSVKKLEAAYDSLQNS